MALALHYGWKDVTVPIWIVLSCAAIAAVGTAYGGWRVIRTLGLRMTVRGVPVLAACARRFATAAITKLSFVVVVSILAPAFVAQAQPAPVPSAGVFV
jgi:phosphate/sulfate permease